MTDLTAKIPNHQPTKVLVCGTRSWVDDLAILKSMRELPDGTVILHGGAQGADHMAGRIARSLGFEVQVYPANWMVHGKAAGPIRNRQMLDRKPDLVLAFWDGMSRGTRDTIDEAARRAIPVKVIRP